MNTDLKLSEREALVFESLADDESKQLFLSRKIHKDNNRDTHSPLSYMPPFISKLNEILSKNRFIIYGYGGEGHNLINYISSFKNEGNIVAIWDKNRTTAENVFGRLNIQAPPASAEHMPEFDFVIVTPASYTKYTAMADHCISVGIPREKIFLLKKFPDQYLPEDIIKFGNGEIFVDGGCFDFSDSMDVVRNCRGLKKIYAFEPDPNMHGEIKNNINRCGFKNVEFYNTALWSSETQLRFNTDNGRATSMVSSPAPATRDAAQDDRIVSTSAIDKIVPANESVTFIKLDIEGSELEALKGAANVIKRCKPKLAVCIYHKPDDYFVIPEYIKGLVPEYKFYIRHYHYTALETVLYAII